MNKHASSKFRPSQKDKASIRGTIDRCADALTESVLKRRADAEELRGLREARARRKHKIHAP